MISKKLLSIARDLTAKYPKGPDGSYTRDNYYMKEVWSRTHNKYRATAHLCYHKVPEYREWSGYDPKDLYELDPNRTYCIVEKAFEGEGLSIQAITRRSNILAERLLNARDYVKKAGIEGVYKVEWGYAYEDNIFVYGIDKKDVLARSSVYNGTFEQDITYEPRARFIQLGTSEDAAALNKKRLEAFTAADELYVNRKKQEYENSLRELEEKKEKARTLLLLAEMIEETNDA